MSSKVFCIGFNKTATTSITNILNQFGLETLHHGTWHHWVRDKQFAKLKHYDAFTDGQQKDFRVLDKKYPGSKFILNTRPLKNWLTSRWCHVETNKSTKRSTWISNEPTHIAQWTLERDDYHADVLEYFKDRSDDFAIIDLQTMNVKQIDIELKRVLEDVARKIPEGHINIPRSNPTSTSFKKHGTTIVAQGLRLAGIPEDQWNNNTCTQHFYDDKYPKNIKDTFYNRPNNTLWYTRFREN